MMSETETNLRKRPLKDDSEYRESTFNVVPTLPETITDNETSESGQVGIEQLPVEVLVDILTRLNVNDRKNARAVCNLWYDACNQVDILRTEKLYCNGIDELSPILETLMNSQRRVLNLHFHELKFDEYPESFWEQCGPKILSLDFSNCCINDRTFEVLFRYCSKLEHLSWYSHKYGKYRDEGGALCSNDQLDRIVESELVRDTLISLDINLGSGELDWLSNYTLFKLLAVFPNIKRFGFSAVFLKISDEFNFNVTDLSQSELLARDRLTLASVLNVIASQASVLEKIRLNLISNVHGNEHPTGYACDFITSIPDLKRLKEIDMPIMSNSAPRSQVLRFFSELKFLESASLTVWFYESEDFSRNMLLLFLEHCPKLRRLEYDHTHSTYLQVDDTLLEKLASCRIKDLKLAFDDIIFNPETLQRQQAWPTNCYLSRFSCEGYFVGNNESQPTVFLKLFSNLKEVEFHYISEKGLPAIWNYQPGLKSLIVTDCSRIQFPAVSGDKQNNENHLAVLKDLECLDVEWFLATSLASEFNIPRLKVLRMHTVGSSANDLVPMLPNVARRLPELEVLSIKFEHGIPYDSWILLCSDLKNLRFLSVEDECIECFGTDDHVEPCCECFAKYEYLFQICSTLRALVHIWGHGIKVFYREVISNKVTRKGAHQMYCNYHVPASVPWATF